MRIKIIGLPFGPGPKRIKRMFIGLSFRPYARIASGSIKPIAVTNGNMIRLPKAPIYVVNIKQVMAILKEKRPEAHKWFRNKSVLFTNWKLNGFYRMHFQARICRIQPNRMFS